MQSRLHATVAYTDIWIFIIVQLHAISLCDFVMAGLANTYFPVASLKVSRSSVWDQFEKKSVSDFWKEKCCLCNNELTYNGSTTSNLHDHPDTQQKCSVIALGKQGTGKLAWSALISHPHSETHSGDITKLLTWWCWMNFCSLFIMHNEELCIFRSPSV